MSQVDQAGRVVDDQADGNATARVENCNACRRRWRALPALLGQRLGLAHAQRPSQTEPQTHASPGCPQEVATICRRHFGGPSNGLAIREFGTDWLTLFPVIQPRRHWSGIWPCIRSFSAGLRRLVLF